MIKTPARDDRIDDSQPSTVGGSGVTVTLDPDITVPEVVAVARDGVDVELAADARETMAQTRELVDELAAADDQPIYGINTGFGDLFDVPISQSRQQELQENLLEANTTVGQPLEIDEVRAGMLARAAVLTTGHPGVRPIVVEHLISCLNAGVHPVVYDGGNVDDYGGNARIGAVLLGQGEAYHEGTRLPAAKALDAAGLEPLDIQPKEALPLMDGPGLMTGRLALATHDAHHLLVAADVAGAATFELIGTQPSAFSPRVVEVRPHTGDGTTARMVRDLLELDTSTHSTVTQDPLSIRTLPQVNGTAREFLGHAIEVAETELGGAGDNPLVFADGEVLSCGGFNGQHVSAAADALAGPIVKLGHASERRTNLYIEGRGAIPAFVADEPGVGSGLVRAHYSAASLVNEAGALSTASDRNLVVSAGQEDIQSLGHLATDHLLKRVKKIRSVVAIELLAAVEGSRLTDQPVPSRLDAVLTTIADAIDTADRTEQIAAVDAAIAEGAVTEAVTDAGIEVPMVFDDGTAER